MTAITDGDLYARGAATLLASWEQYARGSSGAALLRLGGVAAAVFPDEPERAFYNNALLDRGLGATGRATAVDAMETAYAAAEIERFAAWVHESDEGMRSELSARGYTLEESTRAMGMSLDDIALPPPEVDFGPSDWFEYLRILGVPGLLRGVDPTAFHILVARLGGENVATAMAFDHDGDCGVFNVSTLERHAGAGSARRSRRATCTMRRRAGARRRAGDCSTPARASSSRAAVITQPVSAHPPVEAGGDVIGTLDMSARRGTIDAIDRLVREVIPTTPATASREEERLSAARMWPAAAAARQSDSAEALDDPVGVEVLPAGRWGRLRKGALALHEFVHEEAPRRSVAQHVGKFRVIGEPVRVGGQAWAGGLRLGRSRSTLKRDRQGSGVRNPVRSETDAFHIAVGSAVVLGVAAALGVLVSPLVGIALCVGALAGAFIWEIATTDPDRRRPLREASAAGWRNARREQPCVLVVANRTLVSDTVRAEIARRAQDGADVHLVVPILPSRIHYIASDVDVELREARDRLNDTLAWARAEGLQLNGTVGDPSVALGAIEDELRVAGADEVIISTLPVSKSNWLETGIVERLREELDIPITHKVVDLEAAGATAAR